MQEASKNITPSLTASPAPPDQPVASQSLAPAPLLHYRSWRGQFRSSLWSIWPIARVSLGITLRRKLFWAVYALGLLFFFMFFFGQYLLAWVETQMAEQDVRILGAKVNPQDLAPQMRTGFNLNGTGYTYRNFFRLQGAMVVIMLALAGSVLVGNDFQFGSVPFYLAKPMHPWHYVLGKCLAIAIIINLMTTLPAAVLFFQYAMLTSWDYCWDRADLLVGIVGYGLVMTVVLSLVLMATASWLQKTVPMIMAWSAIFFLLRFLAFMLVERLRFDPRWRLIDLWNNMYLVGNACLGMAPDTIRPRAQPQMYEAALVLGGVCAVCLIYLSRRIRGVEIVR